uniref:Odorant receptor n=1 Tax=Heliothis virescens TaxID=7102 RepID=A0A2A4JA14_HELVI
MRETPNYQIATALQTAGVIFTCYPPATITAFLIVVSGYVEAQMLSLTEELLHLWEDAEEHYYNTNHAISVLDNNNDERNLRNKAINEYVEKHLKDIIQSHGRNINLLHNLEKVFSGAIAVEFLLLMIGLIAELLGGLENTYLEIPFALMQVGMDCFTGQRVMDASVKFERAVYDCKWECYNLSNMKIVQTMLQSSQKTMKLSAGAIPIPIYILTVITCTIYFYVYVICGVWFTFWRCQQTGDVAAAMVALSLNCTSEVAVIKLFYMIFNEKLFKDLTDKYLACDSRTVQGSRFARNMTKALRNVKMRAVGYWIVLMVNAVLYVIKPFAKGRHLALDEYVILGLEPMLESPNFEIATTLTAVSVHFICYTVANVSGFLIVLIGYTEAQMLSLSEEVTHLWGDANNHYQKIMNDLNKLESVYLKNNKVSNSLKETDILHEYIKKHLIDIIRRHAVNMSLLQEIENIMRGPNAVGFLFLIVGLIAELLGGLKNTVLQIPFTLTQLGMDCYLGQKIMDANLKFERAVYDCKWECFNQFNKKIVLVMLQNAQKTMTLSAGGMATLSFSYFMNIIRSSYSTYTTLGSMI